MRNIFLVDSDADSRDFWRSKLSLYGNRVWSFIGIEQSLDALPIDDIHFDVFVLTLSRDEYRHHYEKLQWLCSLGGGVVLRVDLPESVAELREIQAHPRLAIVTRHQSQAQFLQTIETAMASQLHLLQASHHRSA